MTWTAGQQVALFDTWGHAREATIDRVGKRDVKVGTCVFRVADGRSPGTGYRVSRIEQWDEATHRPLVEVEEAKDITRSIGYGSPTNDAWRAALPHLRAAKAALRGAS